MDDVRPGVLLVDKPPGPTSHDLVQRVRRLAGTRRVGHAGTLDPQASGLLLLGIGAATRLLTYLVGLDKTYLTTVRLGRSTTTDDAWGDPLGDEADVTDAVLERLPQALKALTGEIDQVPSSVSAVHVDGRRAHELVRAGERVQLPSRRVRVAIEVTARRGGDLDLTVDCSSGTYVRAIARDLGAALGVGGHITALRRTRIGPFRVEDAPPLTAPLALASPATIATILFPAIVLQPEQATELRQGKRPVLAGLDDADRLAALDTAGDLIGLARAQGGVLTTLVNLPVPASDPLAVP
ncbi:tRNA pseudouridine(55) synthase TruB [uncultured Amnibacterium sp.]|uniref:tRNA pseudouridine(55) synthase TruB n=1 Tax=uncultured Amnibacterium sp. TaxID=1631851 RepID=UPI0035CBA46F